MSDIIQQAVEAAEQELEKIRLYAFNRDCQLVAEAAARAVLEETEKLAKVLEAFLDAYDGDCFYCWAGRSCPTHPEDARETLKAYRQKIQQSS